jgi:hypothetical protein
VAETVGHSLWGFGQRGENGFRRALALRIVFLPLLGAFVKNLADGLWGKKEWPKHSFPDLQFFFFFLKEEFE